MDGVETREMRVIAHVRSDFPEKFGVPRQSGLVDSLRAELIFEAPWCSADALRGLEEFSHIWLLWEFSKAHGRGALTVRPPRLGGNTRLGVFATRSPFRPNPLGLSCVRLCGIDWETPQGPVLHLAGADLLDGTPVFDIKPYLPYADCRAEASGGFTDRTARETLRVEFPPALLARVPETRRAALLGVLACDPRPSYHSDPERRYGMCFAGWEVRFTVRDGLLTVLELEPSPSGGT